MAPQSASAFTATALAARAVSVYAPNAKPVVDRARQWLLSAKPVSTEDHTYRLLGLLWTGAPVADRNAAATALLALQNVGGRARTLGARLPEGSHRDRSQHRAEEQD